MTIHLSKLLPHLFFFYLFLNIVFYWFNDEKIKEDIKKFNQKSLFLILNPYRECTIDLITPHVVITIFSGIVYYGLYLIIPHIKINIVW